MENPDDVPTGQIAAVTIAQLVGEADGEPDPAKGGTGGVAAASETDMESVATHSGEHGAESLDGVDAPDAPDELARALTDREALIRLCLYALDRARSGGVVERLEHGLAGVGVCALRPDGERFDPARHEAGSALPTDDPALEGTVAETEVAGFADHEKLLRAPIVTVYTKRP